MSWCSIQATFYGQSGFLYYNLTDVLKLKAVPSAVNNSFHLVTGILRQEKKIPVFRLTCSKKLRLVGRKNILLKKEEVFFS